MSIRFIARDGSEHTVQDGAQLFEAIKRGEVVRDTLVYDDAKQAWGKAGERFREAWNQTSPRSSVGAYFRRNALWMAYPTVILLYLIVADQLRLDDRAVYLAGEAMGMFIMALLVLTAISGRWSEPIKQRLRYIALLVFVTGCVVLTLGMYEQKLDADLLKQEQQELVATAKDALKRGTEPDSVGDRGLSTKAASTDRQQADKPQLSQREVMTQFKAILKRQGEEDRQIANQIEALGIGALFAPKNFAVPNAIERNRQAIKRYQELIQENHLLAEARRNETDRLFEEQAVLASGRAVYEKRKKEALGLERDLKARLMAQAETMSRFNEFISDHWSGIVLDADGMRFESVEVETQARALVKSIDGYADQITQLVEKIDQMNQEGLEMLEG